MTRNSTKVKKMLLIESRLLRTDWSGWLEYFTPFFHEFIRCQFSVLTQSK